MMRMGSYAINIPLRLVAALICSLACSHSPTKHEWEQGALESCLAHHRQHHLARHIYKLACSIVATTTFEQQPSSSRLPLDSILRVQWAGIIEV